MSIRTATALIDRNALLNNFEAIKQIAPHSKILAVLKANGYGHGLERIAKALPYADAFGVARLDEALALRAAGVIKPIVLLEGFFSAEDLPILSVNNFQTIIHNQTQLDAITSPDLHIDKPLTVWLKVDTGMHRLGINAEDFQPFYQQLNYCKNVQHPVVLMSHLASADDLNNDSTSLQLAAFEALTQERDEPKSLANSAATLAWPSTHFDWVRPGLILYGVSPMSDRKGFEEKITIEPVMTLQSSIIAIREIAAGESVGYGGAWTSSKKTTIAVVAIGYGDGYPRHAENGTPVLINERIVPLIGRVSMDMITVDLGENPTDKIGDIAILWGKGLPVEDVAEHASTIPYELLCNITRRVQIDVI